MRLTNSDEFEDEQDDVSKLIAVYEDEAQALEKRSNFHIRFKRWGVSDGSAYMNYLKNATIDEPCPACKGKGAIKRGRQVTPTPCTACNQLGVIKKPLKRNMLIRYDKAREIERGAFMAEAMAAKGHFERPKVKEGAFLGASEGTRNVEEYVNNMQ